MPEPYYQSDGIVLYNCDWRDLDPALLKADALLTDPPFGIGEAAGKNKSRTNLAVAKDYGDDDWDNEPPSAEDIERLRSLASHQIIWGGNYFHLPPSRCWLVWDKLNSGDFADCELAWTNLDKAVRKFEWMWNGMLREHPEVRVHVTQKPLALGKWAISQILPPEVKSIVDPYAGSGTFLVAAKALGIKSIGVEREQKYCREIVDRLRQEIIQFPLDKLRPVSAEYQSAI
jgi:DNA modification methylase